MDIIDVHSHINLLDDEDFSLMDNSPSVKSIILNALDLSSYENMLSFRKKYYDTNGKKKICIALGLYPPSELKKDYENGIIKEYDDNVNNIIERIRKDKENLSAIGEIGLDGNSDEESFSNDRIIFKKLLSLAEEVKLPVIIHSRKAEKEVIEDIKDHKGIIVLHTFSGKKSLITEALKNSKIYFSIPCIVVHSDQFKQLVKLVPLNRLLTETDSPFMPLKGKKYSEPNDIIESIKTIAVMKEMNETEIAQVLFMNAKRIFPHV